MIIELLMNAFYAIITKLFIFKLPALPSEVFDYINTIVTYLRAGAGLVANYVPLPYLFTLFGVLLAVDIGIGIYHFVMWILRKIPLAGIS